MGPQNGLDLHCVPVWDGLPIFKEIHSSSHVHINPLTTEFFPPRQHILVHSAHTTFVGTPLPQHSLLSGQTWWGPHTWRDPSGNTVNDIHDPHKPSNRRSKLDVSRIFAQHFPKLGPDLTDGTPYTINLHVFLRPWVGSMNIIEIKKILGSMNLIKISYINI